jgi:hypothetical protein
LFEFVVELLVGEGDGLLDEFVVKLLGGFVVLELAGLDCKDLLTLDDLEGALV